MGHACIHRFGLLKYHSTNVRRFGWRRGDDRGWLGTRDSCTWWVDWQMVCIVVANESDVAAFKDYVSSADEAGAAAAPAPSPPPTQPTPAAAAAPAASYPDHSVGMHVWLIWLLRSGNPTTSWYKTFPHYWYLQMPSENICSHSSHWVMVFLHAASRVQLACSHSLSVLLPVLTTLRSSLSEICPGNNDNNNNNNSNDSDSNLRLYLTPCKQ